MFGTLLYRSEGKSRAFKIKVVEMIYKSVTSVIGINVWYSLIKFRMIQSRKLKQPYIYIYICKYTTIFPKILLLPSSLLGTLFIPTMKLLQLYVAAVNSPPLSQHYSVWVSPKIKISHTLYFSHVLWDHFRSLWGKEAGNAFIARLVCYSLDVCKNPMQLGPQ